MINGSAEDTDYVVPEGGGWYRAVDTSRDAPDDLLDADATVPLRDAMCRVAARSVVVLVSATEGHEVVSA
jgi:hypothetical protein